MSDRQDPVIDYTPTGEPIYWSDKPLTAPVLGFTPYRDSGKIWFSTRFLRGLEAQRFAARQGTLVLTQTQRWSDYVALQGQVGLTDEQVRTAIADLQRLGFDVELIDSSLYRHP